MSVEVAAMPDKGKKRFGIFIILGVVALLLLAAIIALPFLIDANQFRPMLESEISGALGRAVKVGDLKLSLLSGGVAADDISIADDPAFSRSPFVHAKSLQVGVELGPLIFSRAVHITQIGLEQPEITLIRSDSGNWNFSSIGIKNKPRTHEKQDAKADFPPASYLTVSVLRVANARVTVKRDGGRAAPRNYDRVEVEARDISYDSVMPFTVTAGLPGGGRAKFEGKAGPIDRADVSLTPFSGNITITRLDLLASGFIEPDSGLAGIIDFNGSLSSDGKEVHSKGRAKADKLQVIKIGSPASRPVELEYILDHQIKNQSGTLSEVTAKFGKAVAHLNGTYDARGETTSVQMKLHGENMPAQDLQALLPAVGVTLPNGASVDGGTLNADLTSVGPIANLVTTGTIGVSNALLAGFDLGAKMAPLLSLTGIKSGSVTEIEKFASELRLAPEGIRASNLVLIVPKLGQLSGSGTVGSNLSLDFKMLAKIPSDKGILGSLSRLAGLKTGGGIEVPFFIRGTTSEPKFVPDTKGIAGSLLDSANSGRGETAGQSNPSQNLGDTLRNLFKKKK
jgi:AsmA protein